MGASVAAALAGRRPLLLVDRDGPSVERIAADLGEGATALTCDITDPSQVEQLVRKVPALGSLVVTAGLSPTMADGERIFDVNLVGTARVLHELDPVVGDATAAVCFASIAGHMQPASEAVLAALDDPLAPGLAERLRAAGIDPTESQLAYGLSKHGVIRLVRRNAVSWAQRGARILSLSPGIIDTPMGRQELEQQPVMQPMIDLVGRMARPEELASVAAFLVSDGASFMNGCDVLVDGGFIAATGA